jgi:ABC-2 type transport system ATP-binding protein
MENAMIRVVDVTHHYGVRPVLRQVNLEVARGEVVALMGPNGMGKSTLVGVIAGALSPIKGHVQIDGKRRRGSEEEEIAIRKMTVYLPADPWLPQNRTGREWLLAVGALYSIDPDRLMDHAQRLLDLFDLNGDEPIRGYSTGQKKKIALACALVAEAPVMLLDEPFSGGLDPSGILALRRILQQRAKGDHYTIVLATPVPELVDELADRVAILRDGSIAACDTVEGLRQLSGATGNLEEVYARLIDPQAERKLERYLQEVPEP